MRDETPVPRRFFRALALLALLGPLTACGRREPPNILILLVDALRPDHLGCYGYPRDTSPTLDALAARGVLFSHATTVANYTKASVASLFSGAYPAAHGVFEQPDRLSRVFVTLAESLKQAGYATAASVPNPGLLARYNFSQGFDAYQDRLPDDPSLPPAQRFETATQLNRWSLAWLDRNPDARFFLYIHYRDVHGPYVPPPPYDTRYWNERTAGGTIPGRQLSEQERQEIPDYLRLPNDHGSLDYYKAQYDGEIRYTDDRIAALLAELDRRGRLANTVIIVTADHGESFLEHGAWHHGNDLFEEELRVPLILLVPGKAESGRRLDAPVQTIDIYPTLLDLLGETPPAAVQGRSLLPLLSGAGDPLRPLHAAGHAGREALREGQWKLLKRAGNSPWLLFNLAADLLEEHDCSAEHPDEVRRLLLEIRQSQSRNRELAAMFPASQGEIDEETRAQLRALGYLQ